VQQCGIRLVSENVKTAYARRRNFESGPRRASALQLAEKGFGVVGTRAEPAKPALVRRIEKGTHWPPSKRFFSGCGVTK
jgi:hypothetical protein